MAWCKWNFPGWLISLLSWGTFGAALGSAINVGLGTFMGFLAGCLLLVSLHPFLGEDDEDN